MKIKIEYTVEVDAKQIKKVLKDEGINETVREFVTSMLIGPAINQANTWFDNTVGHNYEDGQLRDIQVVLIEKNVSKLSASQRLEDTLDEVGI